MDKLQGTDRMVVKHIMVKVFQVVNTEIHAVHKGRHMKPGQVKPLVNSAVVSTRS